MKVWEMDLKLYLTETIESNDVLQSISNLIDKSFMNTEEGLKFHKQNKYKFYVYNALYPIEKSKVYSNGEIYNVKIRTVDDNLINHFDKYLVNEYTRNLKALTLQKKVIPQKQIQKIYSITPVIMKFDNGYWKNNESIETFEKRLKINIIKKYNQYFNTKIDENFELFKYIEFVNKKPISSNYKNIKILGDKISIEVAENKIAQDIIYLSLGTGLGEINSRGFGYFNYKYV